MPFAVALLCHPLGTFAALVATIAAALFAAQSRRFLPTFTAASAASLTLLAFAQVPPAIVAVRPAASSSTPVFVNVGVVPL